MKHPRSSLLTWAAAACLGLGLANASQAQDFKWPKLLAIGTASAQGATFASTNGWAPMLGKDAGITVRIVPEDSELQRYRRLNERRDIHLTSVTGTELRFQTEGIGGYAGAQPHAQRVVWHHADLPWGLVVSAKSDIQTTDDLKKGGVRVSDGVFSPGITLTVHKALPAYLGIPEDEVDKVLQFVPASSYPANCKAVTEGKADVAYCTPANPVAAELEAAPGGIRWLPMPVENEEGWAGYLSARPDAIPGMIEYGASSAKGIPGIISNFLYVAPVDMGDEMAYQLAKWMHQSFDDYKGTHPLSARMALQQFRSFLNHSAYPIHPGTIKYLREIDAWTDADDTWNQQAAANMDQWVAARKAALDEAAQAKIKPDFQDETFMKILHKHTDGLDVFRTRL